MLSLLGSTTLACRLYNHLLVYYYCCAQKILKTEMLH